ncbi:universal stress protein [Pseudonocardia acidicola]|uniref:Universal stress protein n=1 Tax=Pseudonocardia acidicola TaxID=2724939 RepID=A0ABX1SGC1_9PSEU|nr:universal stress protein [Pseudonocardia acidicola]NMH99304.1 universal stress protein [Pseudonocardia acidicola]
MATRPTTGGPPITVCVDHRAPGRTAVRWAAAEAARTGARLRMVLPDCRSRPPANRAAFALALATARGVAQDIEVQVETTAAAAAEALRALSIESAMAVVPGDVPDLRRLVAHAYCPVAVLPPVARDDDGPVVVGVAPWTPEAVVELAFRAADARGAPLSAVRAWTERGIDLGRILPGRLARWDATQNRVRRELEIALSASATAHPEVAVTPIVVNDRPAQFLLALSRRARLLVLGRSLRGPLFSGIAGSPVEGLARRARCPVLLVPGDGPPRWVWLPSRRRGLAEVGT